MAASSSTTRLRVFGASLLGSLLAVAGLEACLRVFLPSQEVFAFESDFPNLAADTLLVEHPTRFYGLAPEFRYAEEHLGRYAGTDWTFRGRPPFPAPEGMRRVGVFGDSCVFGTGLDPADTLAAALQDALAKRGLDPTRVQVLNYGVPGYSCVQIGLLLEEVLSELALDVVVLYPAAWNDQAAAMLTSDIARRDRPRRSSGGFEKTGLYRALDRIFATDEPRIALAEIRDAWEAGAPLYGTRVPEERLAAEFERLLEVCAARGTEVVVVTPAHPPETAERYPRTRRDAETCRTVAATRGVAWVDAHEHLESLDVPEPVRFIDFVHLAPPAIRSLARALVDPVVQGLAERTGFERIEIEALRPARVPMLGDVELEVVLERDVEAPVILVGSAPLRDVRRTGTKSWSGRVPANRAGPLDVLVQSRTGTAWKPAAVHFEAPRVELSEDETQMRVRSRPGDQAVIFLAEAAHPSPKTTPQGRYELEGYTLLPYELEVTCGADGVGSVNLPAESAGYRGTLLAQPLVAPNGVPADQTVARWGAATVLRFDGAN